MLFGSTLVVLAVALLWYMVAMPGKSHSGALAALTADETLLAENLRRHVAAVASREHNLFNRPVELEAAARHIEFALFGLGYDVATQRFEVERAEVRNVEAEVTGGARGGEVVIVGAH